MERPNVAPRSSLLLLLVIVFLPVACSQGEAVIVEKDQIVYGLPTSFAGLDPHMDPSPEAGIILRQVYDTLVYRDPETKGFVPGLATEWAISPDGLTYTFVLRQDVIFHDGTPFNAEAVATNLDRIIDSQPRSAETASMLGPFTGYEIVDEFTIRLLLSESFSPLLDSLSQVFVAIASPTALQQYSLNRYQFHQVGTGPFVFVEYVPDDRIVLRRNPGYLWGPPFYSTPENNSVAEIIYRFFTEPPTRSTAIENNDVQIIGEISPADGRALAGNNDILLIPVAIAGQPLQFLMNTRRFPTDKLAVRQALLYGTNRTVIIDSVFQGFSPIAWGPLAANTLYYSNQVRGQYAHDTGQAQSLLASAGFEDSDRDGLFDDNGLPVEVNIIVPSWGLIPEVARFLKDQWRTIGIRAVLEPVPGISALIEKVTTGNYNLVAYNIFALDPAFLSEFFSTGGNSNWTGYSSGELDNLLREAARQIDPVVRANLYAQVQRIIMDEALTLPIRDYVNLNGTRITISGLSFDPFGWYPLLSNVSILD